VSNKQNLEHGATTSAGKAPSSVLIFLTLLVVLVYGVAIYRVVVPRNTMPTFNREELQKLILKEQKEKEKVVAKYREKLKRFNEQQKN